MKEGTDVNNVGFVGVWSFVGFEMHTGQPCNMEVELQLPGYTMPKPLGILQYFKIMVTIFLLTLMILELWWMVSLFSLSFLSKCR